MFKAIKEYNEMVMKPSMEWLKKHWVGYSVFTVVVGAACVGAGYYLCADRPSKKTKE